MGKKRLPLAVKILNLIPRSFQKTIGYSFLGNKILQRIKSSGSKTAFDIDYGLKKNGIFIFTSMDGRKVLQLFNGKIKPD